MGLYIAVIGDLVDSKKISNRADVQLRLESTLEEINSHERFRKTIASQFTITLGDEFQGLLTSADELLTMLARIETLLHPYELRFGIGMGAILTGIGLKSIGSDGPAFWRAREAIKYIHETNDFGFANMHFISDLATSSDESMQIAGISLLNDLLAFRSATQKRFSEAQRSVLTKLLDLDMYTEQFARKDIADALGITSTALVKRVKAGNMIPYLRSAQSVEKHMNHLLEQ